MFVVLGNPTQSLKGMYKTVADRVVEKVDETLKADVMHWAAFYVS